MAADPLDALRLTLMQDVLPVGLAVVERARRGGPRAVMDAFDGSGADPLGQLREEGEPSASQVRESLDRLSPGLGNPVLKVEVRDVAPEPQQEQVGVPDPTAVPDPSDGHELSEALARIAQRLEALEHALLPGSQPS
ncbi:MAG: hypothetical protein VKM97_06240 [Cyanobacteriota bacterium]|nr:hypothetical protein [Cyanobacteriota bacterium]